MGNILNKEWSQHIDDNSSSDESPSSELLSKNKKVQITEKTPMSSKVIVADFDPRSPTTGIVRTPICYMNESDTKKPSSFINTNSALPKFSINDPRSPTSEYNRTPIHLNKNDMHDYLDESNSSLDNSSLMMSDNSILLQQVPENIINQNLNDSLDKQNNKFAGSNMPRHILQRKQVEKLNKKKMIDYDKENN